jgi:aspartate 1-decarboxylase
MLRTLLKSKIHRVKVTEAQLYYEGSITIDEELMEKADIIVGEKVEVLNLNNGSRSETYAIKGKRGSGIICLNGALAHKGSVGDELIILAYYLVDDKEAKSIKPKIVYVDENNHVRNTSLR